MEIKNISGIDFEERAEDEEWTKDLRCPSRLPLNFKQDILKEYTEKILSLEKVKVLEIGCGWGRNAQYFVNTPNVEYFGFDPSPTSLKLFKKQKFPKERFYVSQTLTNKILSNKYDIIFSTYVLQHVGFPKEENEQYGCYGLMNAVLPLLNSNGILLCHELHQGQNNWSPATLVAFLRSEKYEVKDMGSVVLEGGDKDGHNLIIAFK